MTYNVKIYDISPDNLSRFSLGTNGTNPLFVIGLNPSTADDKIPDRTIKKVMTFAENGGFDSFIMLNLYAQRTPYPDNVHDKIDSSLHRENVNKIVALLQFYDNPTILASWGQTIKIRSFFIDCLKDIYEATKKQNINWLKIGDLTVSRHPRHPSRAPYKLGLTNFDMIEYLSNNKQKNTSW
jgi:hypothetical protein